MPSSATRAVPATTELAWEARAEFLSTCIAHFPLLTTSLRERQDAARASGLQALDALAGSIRELVALGDLGRELDLGWMRSRRPEFNPERQLRRKDPAGPVIACATGALGLNLPQASRVA